MIKEWQNHPLENIYAAVFLDAISLQGASGRRYREQGGLYGDRNRSGRAQGRFRYVIGEHETSKFWLVVLNELRKRGSAGHPDNLQCG